MIRAALLAAVLLSPPLMAWAESSPSISISSSNGAGGTEIISRGRGDDGMTIITEGKGGSGIHASGHEVLSYPDGDGRTVHVFADHPVTRDEVERVRADARAEGERARE
ncbi:MAG: hypothetical protein WA840_13425, partial [Caulobacteraceae bacterium]